MTLAEPDKIAVLDFGGQYAHLIAKRIRELGAFSEILPPTAPTDILRQFKGVILSGGPASVHEAAAPAYNPEIFGLGVPLLGVCYGHQLLSYALDGKVQQGSAREDGFAVLQKVQPTRLFEGLAEDETIWMSHGVEVVEVPTGFAITGRTTHCPVAAMADENGKRYGIQFHAEVTHTPNGQKIYDNFLTICGAERNWQVNDLLPELLEKIRVEAGDKNVFMLLSGGVDSTVAFSLLARALGEDRLYGLHVDTGLMRHQESAQVKVALEQLGLKNFHVVDAGARFLEGLQGITDPEEKRRIIGRLFLDVQREELEKLNLNPDKWLLGQGTLYPDTIESGGTAHADTIKTHHNRVPEVEAMIAAGQVIEPVADLYKDEVRRIGELLGLPPALVWRHTFPGPGLAVQSLCSDGTPPQINNRDQVESRLQKVAAEKGYDTLLLPIFSVGVQGDGRTYTPVAVLQGGARDWKTLAITATSITNQLRAINRVIYQLLPQSSPIGEFTLKAADLNQKRLDLHRAADAIANQVLRGHQLERTLYEFPVIMIPVGLDGGESIVLRPLYSENVMTVEFAKLPWAVIEEMAEKILALPGIDAVFYDITDKPPGTVQWE